MSFKPISLQLANRKIVIIGGGEIALRRAHYFCTSGTDLYVYAKSLLPDFQNVTSKIKEASYDSSHLENAFIVVAATNDFELNHRICSEGRMLGALVNNVSDRDDCDFHIPAIVESGVYTIAVNSGGKDLSGTIAVRDRIRGVLND